jgi:hypothetical protein
MTRVWAANNVSAHPALQYNPGVFHIHNGDLTAALVRRAAIPGEHHPFRESLAVGPVPAAFDVETRARFLSEAYDHKLLRVRNDLLEQERTLATAEEHEEIVLWFEHDLFCLANLLFLLERFRGHRNLSLIWSHEPLATNSEADIAPLFDSRKSVTPELRDAAASGWRAFTAGEPAALNDFISGGAGEFPFLREGLRLHGSRFPSVRNGLGALENRSLSLIAEGASDFVSLFGRLDESHPRFSFGDGEVLRTLRSMAWCAVPVISIAEVPESVPPKMSFALTPVATEVIEGTVDFLSGNDPDSWLGGIHVTKENLWRWDEAARQIVRNRPAGS